MGKGGLLLFLAQVARESWHWIRASVQLSQGSLTRRV